MTGKTRSKEKASMRRLAAVAAFCALAAIALAVGFFLVGRPGGPPRGIAAVPVPGFPSGLSLLLSDQDAGQVAAAAPGLAGLGLR
jgi:hypothetical protein